MASDRERALTLLEEHEKKWGIEREFMSGQYLDLAQAIQRALSTARQEGRLEGIEALEALRRELSNEGIRHELTKVRLRIAEDQLKSVRDKLHSANRPTLREGLRIELRGDIDAAMRKLASEDSRG